jgi:hypothetical protein
MATRIFTEMTGWIAILGYVIIAAIIYSLQG